MLLLELPQEAYERSWYHAIAHTLFSACAEGISKVPMCTSSHLPHNQVTFDQAAQHTPKHDE